MSGFEEPGPLADWAAFRAARDRFFAQVRPEAVKGAHDSPAVDAAQAVHADPAAGAPTLAAGYEAA